MLFVCTVSLILPVPRTDCGLGKHHSKFLGRKTRKKSFCNDNFTWCTRVHDGNFVASSFGHVRAYMVGYGYVFVRAESDRVDRKHRKIQKDRQYRPCTLWELPYVDSHKTRAYMIGKNEKIVFLKFTQKDNVHHGKYKKIVFTGHVRCRFLRVPWVGPYFDGNF